jgi:hypothetical protein
MSRTFPLIDLVSQCRAVEHALAGRNDGEKIAWLSRHGSLATIPIDQHRYTDARQVFHFRSTIGLEAVFFLDRGRFVFVVEHTTFRPDGD